MSNFNSVSMVVQSRITQRNINNLQNQMIARGQEVSTGLKNNLVDDLGGEIRNYIDLTSVHQSLLNRSQRLQTGDNRLAQMEITLEEVSNTLKPFQELQTNLNLINRKNMDVYVDQASSAIDGIKNAFNIQWGGRYLFSGDDVKQRPIENIDQLTNAVQQVITDYAATLPTGQITETNEMEALIAEIDQIFDDTHPTYQFSDLVYQGSTDNMAGIEMSEGEIMQYNLRGDSAEFRKAFKGITMISETTTIRNIIASSHENQVNGFEKTYLEKATEYVSGGASDIINARASLGFKQERIAFRQEGIEASIHQYEVRIGNYRNADPYEASVAYSELQRQLETSFYVTSQIMESSLLNYIR